MSAGAIDRDFTQPYQAEASRGRLAQRLSQLGQGLDLYGLAERWWTSIQVSAVAVRPREDRGTDHRVQARHGRDGRSAYLTKALELNSSGLWTIRTSM